MSEKPKPHFQGLRETYAKNHGEHGTIFVEALEMLSQYEDLDASFIISVHFPNDGPWTICHTAEGPGRWRQLLALQKSINDQISARNFPDPNE